MGPRSEYHEYMYTSDGQRVPSPYASPRAGNAWWCLACECSLDNAQHLEKKNHKVRAWWWCFGCTERGYEQRARAPGIVWDSQELTPKFWSNSPTDDAPQQFARAAQQAQQQQQQFPAPYAAEPPPGIDDVHMKSRSSAGDQHQQVIIDADLFQDSINGLKDDMRASRDELANEVAHMKERIAELKGTTEELVEVVQGISKIMNALYPRGAVGVRTLSSSASAGTLPTLGAMPPGPQGPYDQHHM